MLRTAKYIAILGSCLALAAFAAAFVGRHRVGGSALAASLTAAVIVWIAFSAALFITLIASRNRSNPFAVVQATLLGMIIRTAIPFGIGLWLGGQGGMLAEGGVMGFIVVHFLVALVVETPLTLRLISKVQADPSAGYGVQPSLPVSS